MKRTAFSRKLPPSRPATQWGGDSLPGPRSPALRIDDGCARAVVSIPKLKALRSEAYRRLVAAMPCMNCRLNDGSQAAHPNTNKAKGLKADDRLCFPLCAVRFNAPGCHYLFDQYELYPRAECAAIADAWGKATRAAIVAAGAWPARLPRWQE